MANQKSIFAASRIAARMVEQDRPVLDFAASPDERVRQHLRSHNFTSDQIEAWFAGYRTITTARKQLGLDK